MNNIEIIILAGGIGERIKSISKGVPKPLMKINNGVFLDLILDKIYKQNSNAKVYLSLCNRPDLFQKYLKNSPYKDKIKCIVEPTPLGTGGAIKNVIENTKIKSPFIVVNGDTLSLVNIKLMLIEMKKNNYEGIIGVSEVEESSRYGSVVLKDGKVIEFKEKSKELGKWINNGHYIFKKEVFLNTNKSFSLEKDLLPSMAKKNQLGAFKVKKDDFIDIGIPADYYKLYNRILEEN